MTIAQKLATPVRSYFNPRFEAVVSRLSALNNDVDDLRSRLDELVELMGTDGSSGARKLSAVDAARLHQAELLGRLDLRDHNAGGRLADFGALECQAVSAGQCDHPRYMRWATLIENWDGDPGGRQYNRKVWEWAFILQSIEDTGLLGEGRTAVGFGVGNEPMPAVLAAHGIEVLATDQGWESGSEWATTNELMGADLSGLSRPHIVDDACLAELVRLREVDMNAVPADIGQFDIVWSSCVIEHLGTPQRGMDFVLESCKLLRPGGVAVHTTELELTPQSETRDYGHCAVYRIGDLEDLARRIPEVGGEATFNFAVSMDRFEDRWISVIHTGHGRDLVDGPHLKLAIGDSVSTSFGILIRKPAT
jgi:SAM-dependent methyltransferase